MTAITIDQRKVMGELTLDVRVTGRRRMRMRTWLAVRLLVMAGWVLGTQCTVVVDLKPAA